VAVVREELLLALKTAVVAVAVEIVILKVEMVHKAVAEEMEWDLQVAVAVALADLAVQFQTIQMKVQELAELV
jgi:hypothetical protein